MSENKLSMQEEIGEVMAELMQVMSIPGKVSVSVEGQLYAYGVRLDCDLSDAQTVLMQTAVLIANKRFKRRIIYRGKETE